jgi:hypothetical protein
MMCIIQGGGSGIGALYGQRRFVGRGGSWGPMNNNYGINKRWGDIPLKMHSTQQDLFENCRKSNKG